MKKQYTLALLFLLFATVSAFAQKQLKGKVKDSKGAPIASANVNLKDKDGNIISFTRTDSKGEYSLSLGDETKDLSVEATIIGYEKKAVAVAALNQTYDLVLQESEINLKPVVVKNRPSLTSNGDTLNYKTSDFADKQDRSIGDVLKKMPGIEVAENGKISYNGKSISNFYFDGDNLLDDKYGVATKSVPHGAVDKVQIIEKDQPIKMLRKNNMSDDVALNLVMKDEARLKIMGDIKAGLGTPDRFDGNLNAMMFKKNIKFLNNIKGNNIGIDPGIDLTSFNDFFKRQENDKPGNFLSAGAAGVPTLPQNRSLFNKAGLINLNNLFKFNQDLQLKANVSYLYDQRNQQYNKFSETYLPGQTIRYTELQNNSINPQKLHAQFNLNSNAEMHYLNNTFIADYNPFKTNSEVFINGIGANQSLSQRMFDISNEFNYRRKLKSTMVNFYSYIDRSSQPETLNIRPGLNENILNNNTPYAGLNQYISFPTWFTNNYFSFALVNGKFTQTYKAGFNWQNQKLGSELYRIQNDQTTELVSADMTNDLNWTKFRTYAEANYEYAGDKLKVGLALPLSYNKIDYNDASHALDKNLEKFFINPVFNIKYQTGIENYITANYGFKNDLGGLDEVYRGTILKNYRSLFANDAPISEKKTHFAGAGFNFRKAMQMFFFSVNANYSNTTLNTISSYTLTNSIQQRIVLPLSNQLKSFSVSANSSKYLFSWRSTINGAVSFSQTKLDQLLNNELLPFTSETMIYKAGIESKLTSFMTWSYNANYSVNTSKSSKADAITTKYQQLRQQSALTATLFRSLFVNLTGEHIFTHQASQPDLKYIFADLNVRYRFVKIKTDLEFGVTNLANVKKFEAINLSVNSLTSGTYYIPGRVAMLKATFNF
ncbi:TonB-dependent receptor [Pedobacter sp. ASV12]|uniref:TonB-dependent receptor n=1 Tax=Pedobacter sp. ASV12 TaxID=2795120 RepID=UPI0018EB315C|nr:carboxypeptidase-like regulatory domain-containing protein [Pedobacter sp. ASV12]